MSLSSRSRAILVAIVGWTGEHRAFIIEIYLKNCDPVIAMQPLFRRHFGAARHGRVPDRKTVLLWVENLREKSSALKKKLSGRFRSLRTPENIAAVRQTVTRSPRHSFS
jgi:hypothetical protein